VGNTFEPLPVMSISNKKKILYPLIGVLVCSLMGVGIYFYINANLNIPLTIKDINMDSGAALKLNLLEQVSKKNGITEWKLKASSATLLKEENRAILKDVDVIFYTRQNTKIYLTSDEGILNTRTHDMSFLKNVIVRHETYTLRTDQLHYEKKPHIIRSNVHVTLEDRESIIEADSMVTQLNQNKTILKGHVKGKFSEKFNIP
jgi:lipopolysaccharide export system protein LptC